MYNEDNDEPNIDFYKSWESEYTDLFNTFSKELQEWSCTSKLPTEANQDLKYFLKLRDKRLKTFNLGYEYKLEEWFDNQVTSGNKVNATTKAIYKLNINKFAKFLNYRTYRETTRYIYNNDEIFNNKRNIIFYQTIYDINKENDNIGEAPYTCPNCGAVSKIKDLQDQGCPYCRTRYMISDLFPKVVNYFTMDSTAIDKKEFKTNIKKAGLIIAGISLAFSFLTNLTGFIQNGFGATIFAILGYTIGLTAVFGFLAFMVWGYSKFFKLIFQAAKSMPLATEGIGSKKELTNKLKEYDENFSYEYFEGRCISLIRNIVFNEDAENFPQYAGGTIDNRFRNIVDISYRMVIKPEDNYIKDDYIFIKMKVFLTNTYFINNQIENKDEALYITMKHNRKFKTNVDFSINEVNCRHCGASFNATTEKYCPFCHNEYKPDEEDWLVIGLEYG